MVSLSLLKLLQNCRKSASLTLVFYCGAIWRRREKLQYGCTTTIPYVHKSHKDVLENLLPVWLLVRTNLFIPSRFWTIYTNFDNAVCAIYQHAEKFYIGAHLRSWLKRNAAVEFFLKTLSYIRSGAHKLSCRFFDFSQFSTAISRKLWRHLATKIRTV